MTHQPTKAGPKYRTLTIFIESMCGKVVTVELKSDVELTGFLDECTRDMNLTMVDVRQVNPQGFTLYLDTVFVQGKMIRYVHVPDSVNVMRDTLAHTKRRGKHENMFQRVKRKAPPPPPPPPPPPAPT